MALFSYYFPKTFTSQSSTILREHISSFFVVKELAPGCTERVYCLKSIEEFQISKISVQSNLKNIVFENSNSASIWLIFQGKNSLESLHTLSHNYIDQSQYFRKWNFERNGGRHSCWTEKRNCTFCLCQYQTHNFFVKRSTHNLESNCQFTVLHQLPTSQQPHSMNIATL